MPSLGRVLIVEDEPRVSQMLADVLTSLGYESVAAQDGINALQLVVSYGPEVVLLDMRMPGMSGTAVLHAFRRDHPEMPIIMVTANQDEQDARKTLALDAFDYVRKPFDIALLGRVLSAALAYRAISSSVSEPDAANLAGFLLRQPSVCIGCIAAKLVLTAGRISDAVSALSAAAVVDQELGRCATCGRASWVISLRR